MALVLGFSEMGSGLGAVSGINDGTGVGMWIVVNGSNLLREAGAHDAPYGATRYSPAGRRDRR